MKTQLLRVSVFALAVSGMVLCAGCEEERAQAEVPVFTPAPAAPAESTTKTAVLENTNAAPEAVPATKVVQPAVAPEEAKTSPATAEIIKLVQAGVSEEVILSYITNSTLPFNVGSDQIVYLNDLGVSSTVITSLIEHDKLPGIAAKNSTVGPSLPPGVALT